VGETVNVFGRALEILNEHGWYQGDLYGPAGERCLQGAWRDARAELHPAPRRRWWRHLPWPAMAAHRAEADRQSAVLRAAIEQVTGERLYGCFAQWNDEQASYEDARLALKIAARELAPEEVTDMGWNKKAEDRFLALRKSRFTGPIDSNGNPVMTRTDSKGTPLPLFRGGSGHGTKDDKRGKRRK
jgi:hypothetical protein